MGQLAAQLNEISIHALLAESDRKRCQSRPDSRNFYPRSPCGERLTTLTTSRRTEQFLSTLSLRRATVRQVILAEPFIFISIHALLAESDRCCPCAIIAPAISIHALLAESDLLPFAMTITALDFYPRSPCGERPKRYLPCCTSRIFLSTLSLRRATINQWYSANLAQISIHALLAESDHRSCTFAAPLLRFLSTLSLRRATPVCQWRRSLKIFLSTLSLRRATHCPYRFAGL